MKSAPFALPLFLACFLVGCQEEDSAAPSTDKPVVYVSVPPYQEIAARIAGDAFEVRTLVSENDDPHDYSPTPKQVARVSNAAVLFTGVMTFEEALVEKLSDGPSKIKVVSLTENLELLEGSCEHCAHGDDDEVYVYVKGQGDTAHEEHDHDEHAEHEHDGHKHEGHAEHDHDHDGHKHEGHAEHDHDGHKHAEHDHAEHEHHDHDHGLDPHVWLSPALLKTQATQIAAVLKSMTSGDEAAAKIDANLKTVLDDLTSLDKELTEKLAFMKGETFYVYHGAFAYFAQSYGLTQKAIEIGGRRPEPKELAELVTQAKEEGVKLIFVQPQFDQTSARSLAEAIGGRVLPLDPLERDVFANLRTIAETIGKSRQ